jgi:hypothetical protein
VDRQRRWGVAGRGGGGGRLETNERLARDICHQQRPPRSLPALTPSSFTYSTLNFSADASGKSRVKFIIALLMPICLNTTENSKRLWGLY